MNRPVDSQRQRLYDATMRWDSWGHIVSTLGRRHLSGPAPTIEDAQAYVDAVLDLRFLRNRWSESSLTIRVVARSRTCARGTYGQVDLPGWARRNEPAVLHELAHALLEGRLSCTTDHRAHGAAFAAIYLALVATVMGAAEANALRAEFVAGRVEHRKAGAVPAIRQVPVPSRQERGQAERERARRPLAPREATEAAWLIRRAVAADQFGPAGRKAREHALETARALEKIGVVDAAAAHKGR